MEDSNIEVYNEENNEKYQIKYHENCVLSLKYSHFNDWFISTGKDNIINGWKSPYGAHIFNVSWYNTTIFYCIFSVDKHLFINYIINFINKWM